MRRSLCILLALVLGLTLFTSAWAAGGTTTVSGAYRQTEARTMLDMVNDFRTGGEAWYWNSDDTTKTVPTGLGELTWDYALEQIAMQRAAELVVSFSHTRPNGQACFSCEYAGVSSYGENIAYGYPSAESAYIAWREDDDPYAGQGHRRNMLGDGYTAIGVACFSYGGTLYWVQEFSYYVSGTPASDADDGSRDVAVETLTADPTPRPTPPSEPEEGIPITAEIFPDDAFRSCLEALDYNGDGVFSAQEIAAIDLIDCSNQGVRSLKGIEVFTSLELLECSGNELTELDVSKNTVLRDLYCEYNDLKTLDISANPALLKVVSANYLGDYAEGVVAYINTETGYLGLTFDEDVALITDSGPVEPSPAPTPTPIPGDADGDGVVTVRDAAVYLRDPDDPLSAAEVLRRMVGLP